MRKVHQRGLDQRNEQDPNKLIRDTRTLGQRIDDFFHNPLYVSTLLFGLAAWSIFMPIFVDLALIGGIGSFFYAYTRKTGLPFRLPKSSKMKDNNDISPGTGKPQNAQGITYFGNDIQTNEELWFNNVDMRTHILIFGSTGSGKTEALISLAFNSLIQGSGFIYVDGKGDNGLYAKVFAMTRRMGREDDLLVVNFMTGARDIIGPQKKRISNTLNPFARGSSSMLSNLIVSMMDGSSASPDGDMWKGRAISFVEALMKVLVYARDQELILLDANSIRNYFSLERLEAMVIDKQLVRDNLEPANLENMPEIVWEPMKNYLYNLPGYDRSRKGKQVSQVLEQHGFITMQLIRVFSSLADTYGHILRTRLAEVDLKDVVLNRRILVVLLPALEKSPEELSNLGKIIIASLKAMMAAGLGDEVEGDYREIISRKPTNAPTPYVCILDEYGYYAVKGFAVVPAQARSLGFSAVFAGQDLPAFQKASKEEAASIGANTNIKICMKLEDPIETYDFFMKTAGESYVTKVDNFQTRSESFLNNYSDTRSASSEKRARIDLLDLKEQREGEAHIFFKSTIVRARMFYANPKPVKKMRINHFLRVEPPKGGVLVELHERLKRFEKVFDGQALFETVENQSDEVSKFTEILEVQPYAEPIEKAINALIHYHRETHPVEEEKEEFFQEEFPPEELNLFTPLRISEKDKASLIVDDIQSFSKPLLDKQKTYEKILAVGGLRSIANKQAAEVAADIVRDMQQVTYYPPIINNPPAPDFIVGQIRAFIKTIHESRKTES